MSDKEYGEHYSVMFKECIDFLNLSDNPQKKFADMTFGAGGHSIALAKSSEDATVYSVDQDPDAYKNGLKLIKEQGLESKLHLLNTNFENFPEFAIENDLNFDGILMDLGVSSHQFDTFERGFSFRENAPLDMRMNYENNELLTAADVLNTYSEEDIANIIYKYGEERLSRKIAAKIVEKRKTKAFSHTEELEEICFVSYPKHLRHRGIHPATRTFQALRIYVNRELEVLENTIQKLFDLLNSNGTLAIISFHSLEDRIVKHKFREIFQTDKNAAKILTKKPLLPSEEEVQENKRSRSAKLRVIQKL